MTTTEIKSCVATFPHSHHDEMIAADQAQRIFELEKELERTRQRSNARRREVRRLNAQVRVQKLEIESLRNRLQAQHLVWDVKIGQIAGKIRTRLGDTTAEDRAAERAAFQRKASNRRQAIKGLQRANESLTAELSRRPAIQPPSPQAPRDGMAPLSPNPLRGLL